MGLSLQSSLMFVEDPIGPPQKLEDPLGPEKLRDNLEVQGSAMNGVEVEFEGLIILHVINTSPSSFTLHSNYVGSDLVCVIGCFLI